MSKKQISRRGFLKGLGQTAAAAALAGVLKFVPEAQGVLAKDAISASRDSGLKVEKSKGVEIFPPGSDDRFVAALKTTARSRYNTSAFGGEPDWQQARLFRKGPSQKAVVVPISTDSGELLSLAAAIIGRNLADPIVVGTTIEELRANQSFSGTVAVYRLDGKKVKSMTVQDNKVVGAHSSPLEKPQSPAPTALCCPDEFWGCLGEGWVMCAVCCCYTPVTCVTCIGGVTAFCTAVFCWIC